MNSRFRPIGWANPMEEIELQNLSLSESRDALQAYLPERQQTSQRVPYLRELDGLRAISILLVLGAHLISLPGGVMGVDIFFVISGYLITSVLLNEFNRNGKISISSFYLRRALRIVPAFAVLLICYAMAIAFFDSPEKQSHQYLAVLYAATYTMNWARVLGQASGFIGHTWSLAVEEQFYLLWPVLLISIVALSRGKQLFIVSALVVISTLWTALLAFQPDRQDHIFFGSDTRANQLFVGCLLAFLPMNRLAGAARKTWLIPASLLIIFATTGLASYLKFANTLIIAVSAAWLIAAIHDQQKGWLAQILGASVSVAIGRLSYSLYLWHLPIIVVVFGLNAVSPDLLDLIAIALSFGAATLSYFAVEQPFLRLKSRLSKSASYS